MRFSFFLSGSGFAAVSVLMARTANASIDGLLGRQINDQDEVDPCDPKGLLVSDEPLRKSLEDSFLPAFGDDSCETSFGKIECKYEYEQYTGRNSSAVIRFFWDELQKKPVKLEGFIERIAPQSFVETRTESLDFITGKYILDGVERGERTCFAGPFGLEKQTPITSDILARAQIERGCAVDNKGEFEIISPRTGETKVTTCSQIRHLKWNLRGKKCREDSTIRSNCPSVCTIYDDSAPLSCSKCGLQRKYCYDILLEKSVPEILAQCRQERYRTDCSLFCLQECREADPDEISPLTDSSSARVWGNLNPFD